MSQQQRVKLFYEKKSQMSLEVHEGEPGVLTLPRQTQTSYYTNAPWDRREELIQQFVQQMMKGGPSQPTPPPQQQLVQNVSPNPQASNGGTVPNDFWTNFNTFLMNNNNAQQLVSTRAQAQEHPSNEGFH